MNTGKGQMEQKSEEMEDIEAYDLCKWLIIIISLLNTFLSFIMIVTGITSYKYIINKVMAIEALILIGVITMVVSLLSVYMVVKQKKSEMITLVNMKVMMIILLLIFALGLFFFMPDLDIYVYDNWAQLRNSSDFNQQQFTYMVQSQIISILIFSICICIGLTIQIILMLKRLSLHHYFHESARAFTVYYCFYSSGAIVLSTHLAQGNTGLVIPQWFNLASNAITIITTIQGVIGYYLIFKSSHSGMKCYYYSLLIACFVMMVIAANYFIFFFLSYQIIDQEWTNIQKTLFSQGTHISKLNFKLTINSNLKFAGLYGTVFFLIMIITILTMNKNIQLKKYRNILT